MKQSLFLFEKLTVTLLVKKFRYSYGNKIPGVKPMGREAYH